MKKLVAVGLPTLPNLMFRSVSALVGLYAMMGLLLVVAAEQMEVPLDPGVCRTWGFVSE